MDERGIPTHVLLVDNLCLVMEGEAKWHLGNFIAATATAATIEIAVVAKTRNSTGNEYKSDVEAL